MRAALQCEAAWRILNKDIGFVREGQPVRVKLEAYLFTDYGIVPGVVESISRDAVDMSEPSVVKAEIKTGDRRIIQYLLSPITRAMDETGRER